MIARIWRGRAPLATAGDYQRHYGTEADGHLRAVRGFAGDDYEQAVVEDAARQALSRWDERVSHHEVVAELE